MTFKYFTIYPLYIKYIADLDQANPELTKLVKDKCPSINGIPFNPNLFLSEFGKFLVTTLPGITFEQAGPLLEAILDPKQLHQAGT